MRFEKELTINSEIWQYFQRHFYYSTQNASPYVIASPSLATEFKNCYLRVLPNVSILLTSNKV